MASTNQVNVINNSAANQWRRYSVYKDSGVDWLGEIPGHWEVKRLKWVVNINSEVLSEKTSPDYTLKYIDISNVDSNGTVSEIQELTFENAPTRARRRVRDGDTIISTVRTYLRAITFIENPLQNLIVSTGFAVLRPNSEFNPGFLFRLVQSQEFVEKVVAHSEGIGYPAISQTELANLSIWLPPLHEQKAIASFLDKETARIDELVGKKERLLKLLKEKRTALISHAVTKGLDAAVAMKDSGIEWLGEIPGHWEVLSMRRLTNVIEQGWSPVCEERLASEEEWAVIKLSAVSRGRFRPEEHKALEVSTNVNERYRLKANDFLLTRSNTPDLVGDVCIVPTTEQHLILCDLVYRLEVRGDRVEKKYLCYWFLSPVGRYQIARDARGSSRSMVKVSQNHVRSWLVTLPPLHEQKAIASHLDKETAKLDNLIEKIRQSIETQKEYRTALISAAVTGKIDVSKN